MSDKGQLIITNFDRFRRKNSREVYLSFQKTLEDSVDQRQKILGGSCVELVNVGETQDSSNWKSVKKFLIAKCDIDKYDSALLIGNDDIVPFCRFPNNADGEVVYSDSYYFDLQEGTDHYPVLSVGRLPDTLGHDDGHLLLDLIQKASEYQEQVSPCDQGGITSEVWYYISRTILEQASLPFDNLISSPPFGVVASKVVRFPLTENHLKAQSILLFNLHGEKETPYWFGERRNNGVGDWLEAGSEISVALTPEFVDQCNLINSLVISSACHTTAILDKEINTSLALSFLNRGCLAVIGPSSTAYSYRVKRGSSVSLTGINLICYLFLKNVIDGKPLGESLRLAKVYYSSRNEYDDVNILGCNLLGDPRIKIQWNQERRGVYDRVR